MRKKKRTNRGRTSISSRRWGGQCERLTYLLSSFACGRPARCGSEISKDLERIGGWHTKQNQSLSYIVDQDLDTVVQHMETNGYTFNDLFKTVGGHPPLLRLQVKRRISLETLMILDMVLGFMVTWDRSLKDPLWQQLSFKIRKYKPFLSIPVSKYKQVIKTKIICWHLHPLVLNWDHGRSLKTLANRTQSIRQILMFFQVSRRTSPTSSPNSRSNWRIQQDRYSGQFWKTFGNKAVMAGRYPFPSCSTTTVKICLLS